MAKASLFGAAAAPITSKVEIAAEKPAPEPISLPERPPLPEALRKGKRVDTLRYPLATTRVGNKAAVAYINEEAHRELRRIAIDEGVQLQALVIEGLNDVLAKRGKHRIA